MLPTTAPLVLVTHRALPGGLPRRQIFKQNPSLPSPSATSGSAQQGLALVMPGAMASRRLHQWQIIPWQLTPVLKFGSGVGEMFVRMESATGRCVRLARAWCKCTGARRGTWTYP